MLAGWTKKALAEHAGIDRRTLGAIEAGRSQPQLSTAQKLAASLNMELEALFPSIGFTIAEHEARTAGLTPAEKLQAFHALPQAQQDASSRNLAAEVEAERHLRGES
jgi:DNA-binding XRE family transcriptional regulator